MSSLTFVMQAVGITYRRGSSTCCLVSDTIRPRLVGTSILPYINYGSNHCCRLQYSTNYHPRHHQGEISYNDILVGLRRTYLSRVKCSSRLPLHGTFVVSSHMMFCCKVNNNNSTELATSTIYLMNLWSIKVQLQQISPTQRGASQVYKLYFSPPSSVT